MIKFGNNCNNIKLLHSFNVQGGKLLYRQIVKLQFMELIEAIGFLCQVKAHITCGTVPSGSVGSLSSATMSTPHFGAMCWQVSAFVSPLLDWDIDLESAYWDLCASSLSGHPRIGTNQTTGHCQSEIFQVQSFASWRPSCVDNESVHYRQIYKMP